MMLRGFVIFTAYLLVSYNTVYGDLEASSSAIWKWECEDGECHKTRNDVNGTEPILGLEACKMLCNEYGLLWPKPTGVFEIGAVFSKLNIEDINLYNLNQGNTTDLLEAAGERFINLIKNTVPDGFSSPPTGQSLNVYLTNESPDLRGFSLDMDESYTLQVAPDSNDTITARIAAATFFGARHALETLSQLVFYDEIESQLLIVSNASITDAPSYPYRGLVLDTSRNYFPVQSIKSTIDAMAAVKLNTFHWHITDSHSFPFVSERRPSLSQLGAYSQTKVYTKAAIRDIVQFGLERGVRVLPEFDAPAHVGEGWQGTDLTVCFNAMPWTTYCEEPPCGQFNPIKDELYEYLEDIYLDMAEVFSTTDLFHMGGDEVNEACWNSSSEIQEFMIQQGWNTTEASSFHKLWDMFQKRAQTKAYSAFGDKTPLILWTSTLTDYTTVDEYLNNEEYIIQVWTTADDPEIAGLLGKGYRLIISNYDALYFDCGFGAWIGTGNNWCSPYIGWQKVYENNLEAIANNHTDLVLGGEAALWSEQADEAVLDSRLWPRAAALAERLWSNPSTTWSEAQDRMLSIRERLVRMGIQADSIQPEWCYQNEGYCILPPVLVTDSAAVTTCGFKQLVIISFLIKLLFEMFN